MNKKQTRNCVNKTKLITLFTGKIEESRYRIRMRILENGTYNNLGRIDIDNR